MRSSVAMVAVSRTMEITRIAERCVAFVAGIMNNNSDNVFFITLAAITN